MNYNPQFTNIIEEGGKTYLVDATLVNDRTRELRQLNDTYNQIIELLREASLPIEEDWCLAIATKGADGLEEILRAKTEQEIKRLAIPTFLQSTFRESAITSIDSATWREADSLRITITTLSDVLPMATKFWNFAPANPQAPKTFFPPEAYDAIKQSAKVEVVPELIEESKAIWKLSREVRKLELAGCNAIDLLKQYCRQEKQPQPLQAYTDIMQSRHTPGSFYDADIANLINQTALQNILGTKNLTNHVG